MKAVDIEDLSDSAVNLQIQTEFESQGILILDWNSN